MQDDISDGAVKVVVVEGVGLTDASHEAKLSSRVKPEGSTDASGAGGRGDTTLATTASCFVGVSSVMVDIWHNRKIKFGHKSPLLRYDKRHFIFELLATY